MPTLRGRVADRDDLRVRRRIARRDRLVEAAADDRAVERHDRADRHFAGVARAPRLVERRLHPRRRTSRPHNIRACSRSCFAVSTTVAAENQRPGTADWEITSPALHQEIEGYASRTSVNGGDPIDLFVSTRAPRYIIDVFRMGWYAGAGARRVAGPIVRDGHRAGRPGARPGDRPASNVPGAIRTASRHATRRARGRAGSTSRG